MTYLRRSNVSEKKSRLATLGIVALFVVLFLVHYFFPRFYPSVFLPITSLFAKSESGFTGWIGNMARVASSKYSLVKENDGLRREIASREASALLLNDLRTENESLKALLGRTGEGHDVLGVILSRPPMSPYDTLIIDIGSVDGVEAGDKVYAEGDILIGDVAEAYAHQSKVDLFSAPGRIIPILLGKSGVQIQAVGRGAGNFSARLPVEIGVEEGDPIILPQIRPHTFGVVEKIMVDSSDSLQTMLFKAPANINEIRFVEVDIDTRVD
ncbi:MAG: rod shape-determining protein MreC [Candidatus Taylorbacteria bacterium]|nr:rod shape-determining protein MreC [Candidatus Taylorbacteria bacterium]